MVAAHEARRNVAISWKAGESYVQNANFLTTGMSVLSYGHLVGTTIDGQKIAYDCHFSLTTSTHCHALFDFADKIEQCPQHPHAGHPIKVNSQPIHDPEKLRAGIEAALGTIILMQDGKIKYHERHIARLKAGLYRVLDGKGYYDADPT